MPERVAQLVMAFKESRSFLDKPAHDGRFPSAYNNGMQNENPVQLFAIEDNGLKQLPVADNVKSFNDLYEGLDLGVYSALRTFQHHKFLYLQAHIERTKQSAHILGWEYVLDEKRLRQGLHEACSGYPFAEARVRFDILAAAPTHLGTNSRELIGLMPFTPIPESWYETGVAVAFATALARARPLAKTADFAQARRPYAPNQSYYEYLLVDENRAILEGTGTNFFAVLNGELRTAADGVLEGITRNILLDLALDLKIPLRLEPVLIDEIAELDEAAISGSSRALLPVVQIEDQVVGNGRPGPICQRLLSAYNTFVSQRVKPAIETTVCEE